MEDGARAEAVQRMGSSARDPPRESHRAASLRRHRVELAGGPAAAGAVVVALAFSSVGAVRARRDSPHQRARLPSARPRAVEPVRVRRPGLRWGSRARAASRPRRCSPRRWRGPRRLASAAWSRGPPPSTRRSPAPSTASRASGWRRRGRCWSRAPRGSCICRRRRSGSASSRASTCAASRSTTARDGRAPSSMPRRPARALGRLRPGVWLTGIAIPDAAHLEAIRWQDARAARARPVDPPARGDRARLRRAAAARARARGHALVCALGAPRPDAGSLAPYFRIAFGGVGRAWIGRAS